MEWQPSSEVDNNVPSEVSQESAREGLKRTRKLIGHTIIIWIQSGLRCSTLSLMSDQRIADG